MANDFDPYFQWLQISDPSRPPSHYALLGIAELESNSECVVAAAKNRVQLLQSLRLGPQRDIAQKMLNEVMVAASCLTNPQQKEEYDQQRHIATANTIELTAAQTSDQTEDVAAEFVVRRTHLALKQAYFR